MCSGTTPRSETSVRAREVRGGAWDAGYRLRAVALRWLALRLVGEYSRVPPKYLRGDPGVASATANGVVCAGCSRRRHSLSIPLVSRTARFDESSGIGALESRAGQGRAGQGRAGQGQPRGLERAVEARGAWHDSLHDNLGCLGLASARLSADEDRLVFRLLDHRPIPAASRCANPLRKMHRASVAPDSPITEQDPGTLGGG